MSRTDDVVVVGGGIAGTATAIHLRRLGVRVALLERSSTGAPAIGEHASPHAAALLRELVPDVTGFALDARGIVSRFGTPEARFHDYFFGARGFGLSLDRAALAEHLLDVASREGVRVARGTRVASIRRTDGSWSVDVTGGEGKAEMACAFLVDATGRSSWVARRAGAERERHDRLVAVAAWLRAEAPSTMNVLRIESAPAGWAYVAELPGARRVAAFLTDSDLLPAGSGFPAWASLMESVPGLHDEITTTRPGGWGVFPAELSTLNRGVGDGWAAVGDAFATRDPLSGSGIQSALVDASELAEAVAQSLAGDDARLREHEALRRDAFASSLEARARAFAEETRFADQTFWQRRLGSLRT